VPWAPAPEEKVRALRTTPRAPRETRENILPQEMYGWVGEQGEVLRVQTVKKRSKGANVQRCKLDSNDGEAMKYDI
jgi:hypothetical protein